MSLWNISTSPKLLFVDDEPDIAYMLALHFRAYGADVTVATNGEKAVELVNYLPFDTIILDIMMPDIDGYQVFHRIKCSPENAGTPVIFLTTRSKREDINLGLEIGAVDYITKPFDLRELVYRIRNALKIRELQIKLRDTEPQFITILFLAADPTTESRIRVTEEFREIYEQHISSQWGYRLKLEPPVLALRPKDITRALLDIKPPPMIVHFSGHGTSTGALCFENEKGEAHLVQPKALATLFKQFSAQIQCVVLNACYSEIQAKAIAKHINYVVGVKNVVSDKSAIAFSIGFYQALGRGRSIEESFMFGCAQMQLLDVYKCPTPVLHKRSDVSTKCRPTRACT